MACNTNTTTQHDDSLKVEPAQTPPPMVGNDADERKDILSTPLEWPSLELRKIHKDTKQISLSFHLNYDTKENKLSNLKQKLHDAFIRGCCEYG